MYSFGRDRIHSSENIVTTIRSDCTNHSNRNIVRSFRVGTNCKSRSPELHARDRKTAQIKAIQMKSFSCWTIRSREDPNALDGAEPDRSRLCSRTSPAPCWPASGFQGRAPQATRPLWIKQSRAGAGSPRIEDSLGGRLPVQGALLVNPAPGRCVLRAAVFPAVKAHVSASFRSHLRSVD